MWKAIKINDNKIVSCCFTNIWHGTTDIARDGGHDNQYTCPCPIAKALELNGPELI